MRQIARLSAADLTNLALEAPDTPMHQAVLATIEAEPLRRPDGHVDIERIRAQVESRLDRVPELRRVILRPGLFRGRPLLVDDSGFRIEEHVLTATLPAPGGEAAALAFAERELGSVMDRSRPLWAIWLLEGYSPDRFGVLIKLHHAIADGPSMVNILAQVFDLEPRESPAPVRRWIAARAPSAMELVLDNIAMRMSALLRAARVVAHPLRAARSAAGSLPAMLSEYRRRSNAPRTSLNHPVRPGRRVAALHVSLAEGKRIARYNGVKLNDLFMFVVARSLSQVLVQRAEPIDGVSLHASVAVSRPILRETSRSGNHIGSIVVALPLSAADTEGHVAAIAESMARAKAEQQPEVSLDAMVLLAETGIARAFIRRQHMLNVMTTNLFGPPVPIYLAGARVASPVAMAPIAGNVTVSFAALSYESELTFSVVADETSWPDFGTLDRAMAESWREIRTAAAVETRRAV